MPLAVGEEFAGYTILQVLGAGAMGTVYLVQHPRLPRQDALKVLSGELTTDPQYRARFLREADVAAGLSHPNIVGIHDRGESGDQFWIAIDFVRGTDAAKLLRDRYPRGMPVGVALQIIAAVGSALDYAHQRGLLHRDVKPANILIADLGLESQRVFLADFGIARRVDDTGLTATNIAVGTVAYAAPEQLMGELIDGRADQYALACTAFHLLTGAQPYECPTAAAVIAKHVMAPPPPIGQRRPELAPLDPVFARAMAKRPAERFARCQDFTRELHRALDAGATQRAPQPMHVADTMLAPDFVYGPGSKFPPTQAAPVPPTPWPPQPPSAGKQRARRTPIVVGALAAVALLIGGGIFAVVKLSKDDRPRAAAPPTTAPPNAAPPNTGPFTGTYRVDYAPATDLEGKPVAGSTSVTTTWGVRSMCGPSGCVATASHVSGATTLVSTMVFDDVGGRWVAVSLATERCPKVSAEAWLVLTLQPRPDGTLSGESRKTSVTSCVGKNTVTFTRIGDVDTTSLPDPASQTPRVASPAEALHGRYHETITSPGSHKLDYDWTVRTDCLRTGDRCMSFFHEPPDSAKPTVFSGGSWILAEKPDLKCPAGDVSHVDRNAQYPLPQPPQDPITVFIGHGHQVQTGSCALSTDYDDRFERTGD
jgi:tRNA A-37 threonylcarbamoyl transferase component Bud32